MKHTWRTTAIATLLVASTAACSKKDAGDTTADTTGVSTPATVPATGALAVTDVRLGKAIDAERRVTNETDDFKPGDTIYASVLTSGAGSGATLLARWTFEDGQLVDSTSQSISPTADAATEFHISRPGGFPPGKYKLTVLLNGSEVRTKDFEVER